MKVPSPGRIVHYKIAPWDGVSRAVGQYRPAIIVRVFGETPESAVNLQVFLDGTNDDEAGRSCLWATSRQQGDGEGQWTWPPYVPDKDTAGQA